MIAFIDESYMEKEEERSGFHQPVLLEETIRALQPASGKIFFDGTVGGAGHTRALLEKGASVIACDQDPDAISEAAHRLSSYRERVRLLQMNFGDWASKPLMEYYSTWACLLIKLTQRLVDSAFKWMAPLTCE